MAHKRPAERRRKAIAGSEDSVELGLNGEVVVEEHQPAKKPSLPQDEEEEEVEGSHSDQAPEERRVADDAAIRALAAAAAAELARDAPMDQLAKKRAAAKSKKPTAKKNPPPSDKSPAAHKTKRASGEIASKSPQPSKSTKRKSKKVPNDEVQIEDGGAENGSGQTQDKSFDEMCEMYPRLARELKLLTDQHPALQCFFTGLDDKTAHLMEKELEEVGWTQLMLETRTAMEVQVPRAELKKKIVNMFLKVSKNASRR